MVPVLAAALTLILTQAPGGPEGEGSRIVRLEPGGAVTVLTGEFFAAADPEVSFDGRSLLFAGRREPGDRWAVHEMSLGSGEVRRLTAGETNDRQPRYLSGFFTIDDPEPTPQIVFVSDEAGEIDEATGEPATSLYTCRLDGSDRRRLTFNPSSDRDPVLLPDGRLLFASRQRAHLHRGPLGRTALFTAMSDGMDLALFAGDEGGAFKAMPAVAGDGLVPFVETEPPAEAGRLAAVSLRRNLRSYRPLTGPGDGLFRDPEPLPDGGLLAARRPAPGEGTFAIVRIDPAGGGPEPVFDDPARHDMQPRVLASRPVPDGRSSGLKPEVPVARLYALNVYDSDLTDAGRPWVRPGEALRLRVLEGRPWTAEGGPPPAEAQPPRPRLLPRRLLGEVAVEDDGSFNIEVPANIPLQLQLIDEAGMALRTCGWIWVRNNENRGCIGCHEDGERTPENRFVAALKQPSTPLAPPPDERREVTFVSDVAPILQRRCAQAGCHAAGGAAPGMDGPMARAYEALLAPDPQVGGEPGCGGRFATPGRARTSRLLWTVSGWNTSRPWDGMSTMGAIPLMPPHDRDSLSREEMRSLVEWIDLGAAWGGEEKP